jgi:pullulanase
MDVVYNHTSQAQQSLFNILVPDYYFRHKANGQFSDGAACGNETASEMPMMQKFMIESLVYWTNEYHIDGFRFDLMGIHDIATMNKISDTLHQINPTVLLYGEGWTASETPLPEKDRALKKHANQLHNIAVFGDDLRDGIKGSVFDYTDKGFASGKILNTTSVKFGIVAAGFHPQIDYSKINYSKAPYTNTPAQTISYCECHDNHTLYDKLKIACPTATETERIRMQELALTIVLTAQGIPFLHAGAEMLRTKKGIENSYNAGDSINAIDWNLKAQHAATVQYITQLIQLRKLHPAFKMKSAQDIIKHLKFLENVPDGIIAFTLNGAAVGDSWKNILVVFNGSGSQQFVNLPNLPWKFVLGNYPESLQQITHANRLYIGSYSAAIFYAE